ncbi:hypothetical protein, partial [Pseudomonas protegens]|uniref:hypothetical protein n=1 Tax=Pseudomonas protegens TaxID=380021 RepID=UPI001B32E6BC
GTQRPGHMSDCFFDLELQATRASTLADRPMVRRMKGVVGDMVAAGSRIRRPVLKAGDRFVNPRIR